MSSSKGPLHRLVRTSAEEGARLVDVDGFVSEEDLRKRYKTKTLTIEPTNGLLGCTVDEEDEIDGLRSIMAAMTYLPTAPFTKMRVKHRHSWRRGRALDALHPIIRFHLFN